MTACAYCHAPNGELFTPNGDSICQTCDAHFKNRMVQARGDAQLVVDPMSALTFASPKKLFWAGLALIAASISLGCVEVLFIGRIHVMLIGFLFFMGAVSLWRSQG